MRTFSEAARLLSEDDGVHTLYLTGRTVKALLQALQAAEDPEVVALRRRLARRAGVPDGSA